jgi:hypothetical protein
VPNIGACLRTGLAICYKLQMNIGDCAETLPGSQSDANDLSWVRSEAMGVPQRLTIPGAGNGRLKPPHLAYLSIK